MRSPSWLSAALVVMLTGCVPYPHRYQHVPHVEGRVTDSGVAAAGVRVTLRFMDRDSAPCDEAAEDATITGGDGHFTLAGERRVRLYLFAVPAHSFESWGFCFVRADGSRVSWTSPRWYRAGPRYGPELMRIECDLAEQADGICSIGTRQYGKWG
jgi:hypothetical protein